MHLAEITDKSMKFSVVRKGWRLLNSHERRLAMLVLTVVVLSALTSAIMVGSIMPFLTVLADPNQIHEVKVLAWAYKVGDFKSDFSFLFALGLASLLAIVVGNLIQMLRLCLVTDFATMRLHSFSTRLLQAYLRQPYEFFLNKHSGELGTQILSETEKVVQYFYRPAADAIAGVFTVVAILVLLILINPIVTIASVLFMGGFYLFIYFVSRKVVSRIGLVRAEANKSKFRIAHEVLAGVKDVKLLGREAMFVSSYWKPSFDMAKAESKAIFIGTLPIYVMQIIAFGGMIVLVLALLVPSKLDHATSLGTLIPMLGVFAFGGQRLIPELAKVYTGIAQINYGASAVEAIYRDLEDENTLPPLPPINTEPMGLKSSLELRDVSFKYPNAEAPGLTEVSLNIRAGERIGIVGGSGAGKTTLADIIMGLLRAQSGEILVDGITVAEENILSWQRTIGYVQQGIFLSDTSILENIAFGIPKEKIDTKRALDAARMAHLDRFVKDDLPEGYDTLVGERGVRLSGGQRQRIGIARALYNHADLIVFDEATSALDNITEKQVMDLIDTLPGGKTVILIAHRLSTLGKCDRLIVLDHGKVVGVGTWDELMSQNAHLQSLASAAVAPLSSLSKSAA